ncbi:MAG: nucleotidyl transferase AbiEii/AbiGii toxin family protein [Alphaproteobacteria bacterium]|nr:nucleotidyl transferase AbiEii/AbiGii toxin family protein [Alphaproteobacteria bacterium]
MSFIHDSDDWPDLLRIVAREIDRDLGMVEKDYWVTHALWALHHQGFEVWFKGGTSLSKGFGLIERFSEDIDARVDAGRTGLVDPALSWNNRKRGIAERSEWFDAVAAHLDVPACDVHRDPAGSDDLVRSAWFTVRYPTLHADRLPEDMRPFVLLEVGRARVVPFVPRDLSSWVHDWLEAREQLTDFTDNRPRAVRCIHPWVTCLEKLEAIARKYDRGKAAPDFVRHYEDAARIVAAWNDLPESELDLPSLVQALATEDRKQMPTPDHPAFSPRAGEPRWTEIADAWDRIGPMYWGPRVSLEDVCATLRQFLADLP